MSPREIKAALTLAGIKPIQIARELKITPTTVSAVIARRSTSRRVFEAIAKAIGKPVDEVFPKRTA